jgi:hypothetical protein
LNLLQLGTQPRWCLCHGYGFEVGFFWHETGDMRGSRELEPDVERRLWILTYGESLGPRLDHSPVSSTYRHGVSHIG